MARSRDKGPHGVVMSSAFHTKANQELTALRTAVANSLQEDIVRMFEDESHSDLIITNGKDSVHANRCIVQVRAKHLWQDSWISEKPDSDGSVDCIEMPGLSRKQLEDFVRQLYSVSDGALLMEEYVPFISGRKHIKQGSSLHPISDVDSLPESTLNSETVVIESTNRPTSVRVDTDETFQTLHLQRDQSYSEIYNDNNRKSEERNSDEADEVSSAKYEGKKEALLNNENLTNKDGNDYNENISLNGAQSDHSEPQKISTNGTGEAESVTCAGSYSSANGNHADAGVETADKNEHEIICTSAKAEDTHETSSGTGDSSLQGHNGNVQSQTEEEEVTLECAEGGKENAGIIDIAAQTQNCPDECHQEEVGLHLNGKDLNEINKDIKDLSSEKDRELSDAIKASYALSVPYEPCSPLGRDLLQMHLQELHCDCCLSVDGVHFLAHRCVLSARSEYFEAMFGGRWSESNMSTVTLEGVAPQALEQLLLFLYGGVVELANLSDMNQLFVIADMYGISALKTVLAFHVKKDLCHFFHRPCQVCTAGACETLALCNKFNLEELQTQCLKWMGKNFTKIWPTKSFSSMAEVLQQQSLEAVQAQMTPKNVVDTILQCDKLTTSLPRIKWTENVLFTISQLMDSAIEFTSTRFLDVIQTQEFLEWSKAASWRAGVLEEIFNSVIDSLPVDTACFVFQNLSKLMDYHSGAAYPDPDVVGLLESMIKRCEKYFRTHIHQVMRSSQWSLIPKEAQDKIMERSSYVYLEDLSEPKTRPPPRISPKVSLAVLGRTRLRRSNASTDGEATGASRKRPNSGSFGTNTTSSSKGAQSNTRPKTAPSSRHQESLEKSQAALKTSEKYPSKKNGKSSVLTESTSDTPKGGKKAQSAACLRKEGNNGSSRAGTKAEFANLVSKSDEGSVKGKLVPQDNGGNPAENVAENDEKKEASGLHDQRPKSSSLLKSSMETMPQKRSKPMSLPASTKTSTRSFGFTSASLPKVRTERAKSTKLRVNEQRDQVSPPKHLGSRLPVKTSRSRPTSQVFDEKLNLGSTTGQFDNAGIESTHSVTSSEKSESSVSEISMMGYSKIVTPNDRCNMQETEKNNNNFESAECQGDHNMPSAAQLLDNRAGSLDTVDTNFNLYSTSSASSSNVPEDTSTFSSEDPQGFGRHDGQTIDLTAVDNTSAMSRASLGPFSFGAAGSTEGRDRQMEKEAAAEVKIVAMSKSLTVGFYVPPEQ